MLSMPSQISLSLIELLVEERNVKGNYDHQNLQTLH